MKLFEYIDKQSKLTIMVIGIFLILLLGLLDYLTGSEIAFSIFYLFPISFVAWSCGKRNGVIVSIIGAASTFTADLLAGTTYSSSAIPYWNALVRLGSFLIITWTLVGLKNSREKEKELDQFIIHDLRSPLGNVMSGLQSLQEIAEKTEDAAQKELVQLCLISCNRILTLINSLLDLARLESGRIRLNLCDVNIKELIESSANQVKVMASVNNVILEKDLAADVETVHTDIELTTRVLVNLLSNAIKFSKPGSVIKIQTEHLNSSMLSFSIIDQGRGIPKELADKVFDKFIQVNSDKAGNVIGSSGIGLTFCRLAVESLGGSIWLKSNVNMGTTFSFTLPLKAYDH